MTILRRRDFLILYIALLGLSEQTSNVFKHFQEWSLPIEEYESNITKIPPDDNEYFATVSRAQRQTPSGTSSYSEEKNGGCVMPESLPNGTYSIRGALVVKPGQLAPDSSLLILKCPTGYASSNSDINFCNGHDWYHELATCQKMCKAPKSLTVKFTCSIPLKNGHPNRTDCNGSLVSGTKAFPVCQKGHHSININKEVICDNGNWFYTMPSCKAECGKTTPRGTPNVINGTNAVKGEFPWHVAVYNRAGIEKNTSPPKYWCGGSIISRDFVISAAHCFYNSAIGRPFDADLFTIAVGKVYSEFDSPRERLDPYIQKSEVKLIQIPPDYVGEPNSYSHDLALLLLETPLNFSNFIMPICLNLFEINFDNEQSSPGVDARVAGFGLVDVNGDPSDVLKTAVMPIISKNQCKKESPEGFSKYVSWDKICAGSLDGVGVCKGDSGGGLVVSTIERNSVVWYLRGIVSTSPASETNDECTTNTYATFTKPFSLSNFIEDVLYRGRCTIPENPPNGKFTLIGLSNAVPGETVAHRSQLTLKCSSGFAPSDRENNVCDEFTDDWIRKFSTCEVMTVVPHDFSIRSSSDGCVMPNQPQTGLFEVVNLSGIKPGDLVPPNAVLTLTCPSEYSTTSSFNVCDGYTSNWQEDLGDCKKMCDPLTGPTLTYNCSIPITKTKKETVTCDRFVPSGTIATPECDIGYHSDERLVSIVCEDGIWSRFIETCDPECGIPVTHKNSKLKTNNGRMALKGEFPWHAAIYEEISYDTSGKKQYICSGSIISRLHIVSVAPCFEADFQAFLPQRLLVIVGKMYSDLDSPEESEDEYIQRIKVKEIEISDIYFEDDTAQNANDVAVLILERPLTFSAYVMPICLDQVYIFDEREYDTGVQASVSGFNFAVPGKPHPTKLKTFTSPIVSISECKKTADKSMKKFITFHKICTAPVNGTNNLCDSDIGGGLVVKSSLRSDHRWYLIGIATKISKNDTLCNKNSYFVFTKIIPQKYFIRYAMRNTECEK